MEVTCKRWVVVEVYCYLGIQSRISINHFLFFSFTNKKEGIISKKKITQCHE